MGSEESCSLQIWGNILLILWERHTLCSDHSLPNPPRSTPPFLPQLRFLFFNDPYIVTVISILQQRVNFFLKNPFLLKGSHFETLSSIAYLRSLILTFFFQEPILWAQSLEFKHFGFLFFCLYYIIIFKLSIHLLTIYVYVCMCPWHIYWSQKTNLWC